MNTDNCSQCRQSFPLNDTPLLDGKPICIDCLNTLAENNDSITAERITNRTDPTVCINCGFDNAQAPLKTISNMPACDQCINLFNNYPFPTWVKASAFALLCIVIFAFVFNFRFVRGYNSMQTSFDNILQGDIQMAAINMRKAADLVPESEFIVAHANYCDGIIFLQNDQSAQALEAFKKCLEFMPPEVDVRNLIFNAEIGVAFDNKDYDTFLSLSLQGQQKNPDDPFTYAQIASAYACKFAETSQQQYKQKSLESLANAEKLTQAGGDQASFNDYQQRILHRLHTRKIITSQQFHDQYPNGWKPSN